MAGGKPVSRQAKASRLAAMVRSEGQSLERFAPQDPRFDSLEWIDENRIGVITCGHADCLYWLWI
jgi:hypothetical protein